MDAPLIATYMGLDGSEPSYCFSCSTVKGSSLGGARSVRAGCRADFLDVARQKAAPIALVQSRCVQIYQKARTDEDAKKSRWSWNVNDRKTLLTIAVLYPW